VSTLAVQICRTIEFPPSDHRLPSTSEAQVSA
jgi:hypothetical protein